MNYLEYFRDIHTFIFDVDGVLTNSQILIQENGDLLRSMNVKDGYAMKRAVQHNYRVCIITGGKSNGVIKRLQGLGITDIYPGVSDKIEVFNDYIRKNNIDPTGILYMGDDLPDYPVMRRVGLPACPNDAVKEVVGIAQDVSPFKGGEGCVRDVIEKVMLLHRRWLPEQQQLDVR